ncbi:MAG TPA: histidine kinase [Rhodothermales bacterium]|nr:histidine kinase [Rhodothermales bacterium]
MQQLIPERFHDPSGSVWTRSEVVALTVALTVGGVLILLVYRLVRRMPWPRPFRLRFAVLHLGLAIASGVTWLFLTEAIASFFGGLPDDDHSWMVVVGAYVYAIVAGISYAMEATARAARAETAEAQAQLSALRAQLHPHFLFNALHAVVQLIPLDPARAAEAAELVASLLRTTVEEERDEVPLRDEWAFVSRYLEVERIRFGDRLRVRAEVDPDLLDARLPAFSLHTLVENAVRHGAAPRVAPTEIVITTTATASAFTVAVRNTGDPLPPGPAKNGTGTGLTRLRERLQVLYGAGARLTCGAQEDGGFEAVLVVPRDHRRAA